MGRAEVREVSGENSDKVCVVSSSTVVLFTISGATLAAGHPSLTWGSGTSDLITLVASLLSSVKCGQDNLSCKVAMRIQ